MWKKLAITVAKGSLREVKDEEEEKRRRAAIRLKAFTKSSGGVQETRVNRASIP